MHYVFADESGNFDFGESSTRYFIVTAVTMENDWTEGAALLQLRHDLALAGRDVDAGFHATNDSQAVRNEVFRLLQAMSFVVDAVVIDKRQVDGEDDERDTRMYKSAWNLLARFLAAQRWIKADGLFVVCGALGTTKRRRAFKQAFQEAVNRHSICQVTTAFWRTDTHPCLQIADYCSWAIQRWIEQGDRRAIDQIPGKILTCFEPYRKK